MELVTVRKLESVIRMDQMWVTKDNFKNKARRKKESGTVHIEIARRCTE
jgi:hypothetical protein